MIGKLLGGNPLQAGSLAVLVEAFHDNGVTTSDPVEFGAVIAASAVLTFTNRFGGDRDAVARFFYRIGDRLSSREEDFTDGE